MWGGSHRPFISTRYVSMFVWVRYMRQVLAYYMKMLLQDPGTPAAHRYWTSIDLGTEIYMADNQIAEWTVTDFDITIPLLKS